MARRALPLLFALALLGCTRGGVADLTVRLLSPAHNSRLPTGQEIEFESLSDGPGQVSRVELWVNGELIAEETAPGGPQPSFRVRQRWVPTEAGRAEVLVYAYDARGAQSRPAAILLEIAGEPLLAESEPTATATAPPEPSATPEASATPEPSPTPGVEIPGVITTPEGANIRAGPSFDAARVDGLFANVRVTAIGRTNAGDWIQIRYGEDEREGWLLFGLARWDGDVALLPVVRSP